MPFTDHNGSDASHEPGGRDETRIPIDPKQLAVVVGPDLIAHPVDISAFGLAVLVPCDSALSGEVAVRLIYGESMRMAQGTMRVVMVADNGDGAARVGLEVATPGALAEMLKSIVGDLLNRREAA